MPAAITVYVAGSEKRIAFSPSVFIASQAREGGAFGHRRLIEYRRDGGCTLYLAYLLFFVDFAARTQAGSTIRFLVPLSASAELFSHGRLAEAARDGFKRKPEAYRDEARSLWEVIESQQIKVEAAVPVRGSEDAVVLANLRTMASRSRRGISEPAPGDPDENPWGPKEDPDFLRKQAEAKDKW
ncbi:hypothetical protein [Labrys wisconsinensis]|uniref:Uncharacterized protein n=1 Tax=Labrys wisconsinensis TaxID=425677 RepID=A0ABU0JLT5_9HYPH|nr:hypothetical protein [Labrys wisconsinensis]MDQ0475249.1 hypothetical protein [Labrys wisconsinensis]